MALHSIHHNKRRAAHSARAALSYVRDHRLTSSEYRSPPSIAHRDHLGPPAGVAQAAAAITATHSNRRLVPLLGSRLCASAVAIASSVAEISPYECR
ncbi:MAG: hypothetical protein AAGC55_09925 [Myxococcota bacterium]